jgi:hypothetical protein
MDFLIVPYTYQEMEEIWNQQDSLLRVNRELRDPPEGRVKIEGASQGYEFSSEESEGEENNPIYP